MRQLLRRQLLEDTWIELFDFIIPELYPSLSFSNLSFYIYDTVLNQPWESLTSLPVYKHLSDLDLEVAIILAKQTLENPSYIYTLARGSQQMRMSNPLFHTLTAPNNTLPL